MPPATAKPGSFRSRRDARPLPGFVRPETVLRAGLRALAPPDKIGVAECAERHIRVNKPGAYVGPWRNELQPHLVEPMNRLGTREIDELFYIGPAQTALKTVLALHLVAWKIRYSPGDVLWIAPTNNMAIDFAERRIEADLLKPSPDLRQQLGAARDDDKKLTKVFLNGTRVTIGWPSASELASRPVPIVIVDERDRMADDVGGEGDPVTLGRNRKKNFGRNGKLVCISSPSREDGTGIVAHWPETDQRLWVWRCPDCREHFTPGFDENRKPTLGHLKWADGSAERMKAATPEHAAATAFVVCPHCGTEIRESQKPALNASGFWLPKGATVDDAGNIGGAPAASRIAGYWSSGVWLPLARWGDMAFKYVAADRHFDKTGEEIKLRGVVNTEYGYPYKSRLDGVEVDAEELAERAAGYVMQTVPKGVLFLTAQVDVQGNRFEVLVKGWNHQAESWLVDRYAIRQLPGSRVDVRPATHPEHWLPLLDEVVRATYPLADDPALVLPIATTAIDMHGMPGVTLNARAFWRTCRRAGVGDMQLTLVRGANTKSAPALPKPSWETDDKGKRIAGGARFYTIGVHALKDTLANRLARAEPGPGYMHYPADAPEHYFRELAAERKVAGEWQRRGNEANESLDLEVYAIAAYSRLRPDRIDWNKRPWWAVPKAQAAPAARTIPAPAIQPGADPRPPISSTAAASPRPPVVHPSPARRAVARPRRGGFVSSWK